MIDLNKRVFDHFEESIRTKQMAQEVLTEAAAQAAQLLFDALANDGKILIGQFQKHHRSHPRRA